MGAVTRTIPANGQSYFGNKKIVTGSLTFGTYATGGQTGLTAADLGWDVIDFIEINAPKNAAVTLAVVPSYDYTNEKVLLYVSAGDGDALDESGAVDYSAYTANFYAIGH
jgi:hypothetical protein